MQKVHLDLGTHYGQGLFQFINMLNIDKTWRVHSFEANPITYQNFIQTNHFKILSSNLNVHFNNKAVYTKNGMITFNIEHPKDSQFSDGMASTVISKENWKPWNGTLDDNFTTTVDIPCIDLSEFVNSLGECEITCKMDIEGAEFDILEKMISDNSILKFKALWIEFHNDFFPDKELYTTKKTSIIDYLNKHNIEIHDWH